jgi:probable phosphoglycerate mutase
MPSSARAPGRGASSAATTLIMVRHGRTAFTEAKRFSGAGGEDPPLSALGLEDAARAAQAINALGAENSPLPDVEPPSVVISSPLQRCRQTGGAIAERCGLDLVVEKEWEEIAFGVWDGLTFAQIAERWPAELARWQGSVDFAPEGAETVEAFQDRITAVLSRTLDQYRGKTILISTHTTPVRSVVASALDAGARALWRLRVAPASISVVRYWGDLDDIAKGVGGVEVVAVNAAGHLL